MASLAESRGSPLWRGPQKAAKMWRTVLGADPLEVLALGHSVLDLSNRQVAPLRMESGRPRSFSSEESMFSEKKISDRLARGTWI
jgi:hypothetical protein